VAAATEESGTATAAPTPKRAELIGQWREAASRTFLDAYRAAWEAQAFTVPAGAEAALDLFLIAKAAEEVREEAANRPGWVAVPLRGLERLASGFLALAQPIEEITH
jgi:maltose alpha-D-glucosyltransferase/alpha-amylase